MARDPGEHPDDSGARRPRDAAERIEPATDGTSRVPDRRRQPSETVDPRLGHAPAFDRTLRRIMNEIRTDGRDARENAAENELETTADKGRGGDAGR